MTKLQITLTDQEIDLLTSKAVLLGYDVTKYAKYVLAREAENALTATPTFSANSRMTKLINKAIEEDGLGKTRTWKSE